MLLLLIFTLTLLLLCPRFEMTLKGGRRVQSRLFNLFCGYSLYRSWFIPHVVTWRVCVHRLPQQCSINLDFSHCVRRLRFGSLLSASVRDCLWSPIMVSALVLGVRETCAAWETLADRQCCCRLCYRRASICPTKMSTDNTAAKKSDTKSNLQHSPAIRIRVELFEPTETRYPVFNYPKLLAEEVSAFTIAVHLHPFARTSQTFPVSRVTSRACWWCVRKSHDYVIVTYVCAIGRCKSMALWGRFGWPMVFFPFSIDNSRDALFSFDIRGVLC